MPDTWPRDDLAHVLRAVRRGKLDALQQDGIQTKLDKAYANGVEDTIIALWIALGLAGKHDSDAGK